MFCSKCGTQNPDSAEFCSKCGSFWATHPKGKIRTMQKLVEFEPKLEQKSNTNQLLKQECNDKCQTCNIRNLVNCMACYFQVLFDAQTKIPCILGKKEDAFKPKCTYYCAIKHGCPIN